MSEWSIYLWIVAGIAVSVAMPIIRKLAGIPKTGETYRQHVKSVWIEAIRPYLFLAIFSLLSALVILAGIHFKNLKIDSYWGAFLLGYFADATIQKLKPA